MPKLSNEVLRLYPPWKTEQDEIMTDLFVFVLRYGSFLTIIFPILLDSYRLCGDHQTAIEIWKTSTLPVYMDELGDHPWTATILHLIADSYKALTIESSEQGYVEQAEMYIRQALELRARLLGFHQDTARSHVFFSDVLVIQGNFQSALDELIKAVTIQQELLEPQHKNTTDTLNKMTDLLVKMTCEHKTKET